MSGYDLDLVLLVADADQSETLSKLLDKRRKSLGIRHIRFEMLKHPRRDAGCFHEAPDLLQTFQSRAERVLVVLDREGSGQEMRDASAIELDLKARLEKSGWHENRCAALALDPELEIWVWSDSPLVDEVLGWKSKTPSLRDWLLAANLWLAEEPKPRRPKEALEAALRLAKEKRSPALYGRLASQVSLKRCQDSSFLKLKAVLRRWFSDNSHMTSD